MLLYTSAYFVFLIAVFFAYWAVSRNRRAALAVLLFANLFFLAKWDLFYLGLIPAAAACDYAIGRGLGAITNARLRKLLVTASVLLNLGILTSFKYMPFFLDTAARLGAPRLRWDWVFPLGISFYCFQSLSYTIDIYRGDAKPARGLLAYITGASFFPAMLSGPIARLTQLVPQLERAAPVLDPKAGGRAFFLIAMGLMKKLLIADYLGENLVNRVFDIPKLYSSFEVLTGVYAYAFQLYYDFSGYSDIAIGSALLLGLKLPENFNVPYAARNAAEFWRRWHMSLSNWLRDYLFFSLPGVRSRWKFVPYLNLFVTMVLGGLWHGPSLNFVVWGALHGGALAITRGWQTWCKGKESSPARWKDLLATAATFHFVAFAWVFFRAPDLPSALDIFSRIGALQFSTGNISGPFALVLALAAAGHFCPARWYSLLRDRYAASPVYVQAAAMALVVIAIEYVATTGAAPFIYTKF